MFKEFTGRGMIPVDVIQELEAQAQGVTFGKICLEISIHDNHAKYRVIKEVSIVPNVKTSGGTGPTKNGGNKTHEAQK
jgi:hypothetical protein